MPTITPFLWFDNNAEEAVDFYASVFKEFEKGEAVRYTENGPGTPGQVMTIQFEIYGQKFTALNGGPVFQFNEAVSFQITVNGQEEVDEYWEKLIADGGEESQCGWLKDKFGLSWQVVPTQLIELVGDPDPARASAATNAMLKMKKIDIDSMKRAADAASPAA